MEPVFLQAKLLKFRVLKSASLVLLGLRGKASNENLRELKKRIIITFKKVKFIIKIYAIIRFVVKVFFNKD